MKAVSVVVLLVLILLAVSSGISKILLMQQEVEFFGRYGFSIPAITIFGTIQVIGGFLMVFTRTRFVGAAIVAITFLISLALILMDGNIPVGIVTVIATLLLGVIMKQSWRSSAP